MAFEFKSGRERAQILLLAGVVMAMALGLLIVGAGIGGYSLLGLAGLAGIESGVTLGVGISFAGLIGGFVLATLAVTLGEITGNGFVAVAHNDKDYIVETPVLFS